MDSITIKRLSTWEDMAAVEQIQHVAWGETPDYILHQHLLYSIAFNGGLILGAYDGDLLVGAAIAFLGADLSDDRRPAMANLKLFSKRLVVLPDYQGRGVGFELKLGQRKFAQKWGVRLITWTFDPLLSRNAHLNIRKLGAMISYFYEDFYGSEPGALTVAGSSDRVQADWWLTSRRVEERVKGKREPLSLLQYLRGTRILNATHLNGNALPVPSEEFILPPAAMGLIEIPADYNRIVRRDDELARAWRTHSRAILQSVLGAGFILTDFVYEPYEGRQRAFYVCSHEGTLRGFNQN